MNADGTTHLVMFDIDGTLLRSSQFDAELFELAVKEVLAISVDTDWSRYQHVSDTGILLEIIEEYQLQDRRDEIQHQVKACFIERVAAYLSQHGVAEIPGASAFLKVLCERDEFSVAIATGGWRRDSVDEARCGRSGGRGIATCVGGRSLRSNGDHAGFRGERAGIRTSRVGPILGTEFGTNLLPRHLAMNSY